MKGFVGVFLVLVSFSCSEGEVSRIRCTEGDVNYEEGESWKRSACVTCTCENGVPLCISIQCRDPGCSNPVTLPDQCCPTCPTVGLSQGDLIYAVQVCFWLNRVYHRYLNIQPWVYCITYSAAQEVQMS